MDLTGEDSAHLYDGDSGKQMPLKRWIEIHSSPTFAGFNSGWSYFVILSIWDYVDNMEDMHKMMEETAQTPAASHAHHSSIIK